MKKWTGTRILAVALCVALLLPYTAFAINSGDGDLSKGTTVITELLPLDDTVLKQTVAYDTPVEALALPDTLNVKGYVYDGTVTEPVSETMTIESVGWTSKPKYDGAAGEYLFLPELTAYSVDTDTVPSILLTVANQEVKSVAGDIYNIENNVESVTSDTYNTEDNVETVIDEIYNIKDTIDLEAMKAGLEENPKPMTLDDAMASYEVQPMLDTKEQTFKSTAFMTQSFFTINSVPVTTYPDTIVVGNDNDNNAHTGVSDGDMDSIMFGWTTNYPIEFSFTLNNLPTESAYIAIKAYDVDEESGEKDYVFINDAPAGSGSAGASIGNLSGNNGIWNTTVLQIPLSKLRLGENYVSINISPGWIVIVDWAQLILDGGAVDTNISNYSIQLDDAVQNGSNVEIASTVNIEQSGSTDYYTEYTLNNEAGDNLDTYFGSAVSEESASLAMPLNSPTGTYTVTGLIKDKATETIKASDRITFEFESGKVPVFGVRIDHTLSPSTLTNGSVAIQLAVENVDPTVIKDVQVWYGSANITGSTNGSITTAHQTVGENGTYAFAAKYILNGEPRITNYKVTVSNIDKVAPTINASDVSVMEDVEDATVTAAINSAITVSDDVSLPKDPYTISSISGFSSTLADKTVTITAQDTAGNETTSSITLSVVPKPLQLTQHDVTVNEAALTASLSGVLDYTGGLNITESGFVWGISQKPTYEVNSGKTSVAGALNKGAALVLWQQVLSQA